MSEYVSAAHILQNKTQLFNEGDLDTFEANGVLTDVILHKGEKYYQRSEVEKLFDLHTGCTNVNAFGGDGSDDEEVDWGDGPVDPIWEPDIDWSGTDAFDAEVGCGGGSDDEEVDWDAIEANAVWESELNQAGTPHQKPDWGIPPAKQVQGLSAPELKKIMDERKRQYVDSRKTLASLANAEAYLDKIEAAVETMSGNWRAYMELREAYDEICSEDDKPVWIEKVIEFGRDWNEFHKEWDCIFKNDIKDSLWYSQSMAFCHAWYEFCAEWDGIFAGDGGQTEMPDVTTDLGIEASGLPTQKRVETDILWVMGQILLKIVDKVED